MSYITCWHGSDNEAGNEVGRGGKGWKDTGFVESVRRPENAMEIDAT
jgi:hypothetical protein